MHQCVSGSGDGVLHSSMMLSGLGDGYGEACLRLPSEDCVTDGNNSNVFVLRLFRRGGIGGGRSNSSEMKITIFSFDHLRITLS